MAVLSIVMPFGGRSDIDFALALATANAMREIRKSRRRAKRTGTEPKIPMLYESKIPWTRDVCRAPNVPGACERFLSPMQLLVEHRKNLGLGYDCDDMGPWRAAELRLDGGYGYPDLGNPSGPMPEAIRSPGIGYHIIVRREDGSIEDPSRVMGMGRKKGAPAQVYTPKPRNRRRR